MIHKLTVNLGFAMSFRNFAGWFTGSFHQMVNHETVNRGCVGSGICGDKIGNAGPSPVISFASRTVFTVANNFWNEYGLRSIFTGCSQVCRANPQVGKNPVAMMTGKVMCAA